MKKGYIKLYRCSKDHWLYNGNRPATKREAWEDMLLLVNYEKKKVLIGNQLMECGRGQSLRSIKGWAEEFNWSPTKVRRFFELLEQDGMIKTEGLKKTTRLTICNYELYQGDRRANGEQAESKRRANGEQAESKRRASGEQAETNKKVKKVKKVKNKDKTHVRQKNRKYAPEAKNWIKRNSEDDIFDAVSEDLDKHANSLRLLFERDGMTKEQYKKVKDICFDADNFWYRNIGHPGTLRGKTKGGIIRWKFILQQDEWQGKRKEKKHATAPKITQPGYTGKVTL